MMNLAGTPYGNVKIQSFFAYCVCGLFVALQFMVQGSVSLMVPELIQAFNIDIAGIGLLSSCFFYPYVFMQIPMGRFISRYGVKRVLFYSACLLSVGCVVFLTATGFYQAMFARMLMGLASAAGVVSTLEVISLLFAVRWFGLLAGIMDVVSMMGAVAGEWFIPRTMEDIGWDGFILIIAIVTFLLALFARVFLPCRPQLKEQDNSQEQSVIFEVLRNKHIWKISIYGGLVFALVNCFAAMWAVPYFSLVFDSSVAVADIVSFVFIGTAIGAPFIGLLGGCRHQARRIMLLCGVVCIVLLWVVIYCPISEQMLRVSLLLMGIACGVYVIPYVQVKKWCDVHHISVALGMVNMIEVLIGTVLFQPLIGFLLNVSGGRVSVFSYHFAFSMLLIGLLFSVVIVFFDGKDRFEK